MTLFDRRYLITIRDMRVDTLRCAFKVKKQLTPTPNTCELKIWNLNADQRLSLEEIPDRPKSATLASLVSDLTANNMVRIEAGYKNSMSLLYLGEVRDALSKSEGPDITTEVSSGDGEKDLAEKRINIPIGVGTPVSVAVEALVKALGCGRGNLDKILPKLKLTGAAEMFVHGTVLSGAAADEFDAIMRSANLEWSLVNGKLQILDRGKALEGLAIKITPDTGLIGSVACDAKGIITFETLMIPDMYPGRTVVVDSKHNEGAYRVEECDYSGDTFSNKEWTIVVKAKKLDTAVGLKKKKKKK